MSTKFSQFVIGGNPRNTDIVVGLRAGDNYQYTFAGVNDTNGNPIVLFNKTSSASAAQNYITLTNSITGVGPTIGVAGNDVNLALNIQSLGSGNINITPGSTGVVNLIGTGAVFIPYGTNLQQPAGALGGLRYSTTTNYLEYWSQSSLAWVDLTSGSALSNLTFVTNTNETAFAPNSQPLSSLATGLAYVTTATGIIGTRTLTGTTNQVTVTNGTGSAGNPTFSLPTTLIAPGTFAAVTSVSAPQYLLTGSGSGTISILPQAAAGTYNFNLPITAGTAGYVLASGGGAAAPMTWTNLATATVTSIAGTANQINASASVGAVTLSLSSTMVLPGTLTTANTVTLSGLTASTALVLDASKNVASLAYQSTGGTYGGTSNLMSRDANGLSAAANMIDGQTSSAAGGTITLTAASNKTQIVTGAGATTIVLPNATTVLNGHTFYINNNSSGTITLQNATPTTLGTVPAGGYLQIYCNNNLSVAGSWDGHWLLPAATAPGQLYIGNGATAGYTLATLTAGAGITVTNGSGSITISGSVGVNTWTDVTGTTQALAVANGYVTDNGLGVTYTLPATASLGDQIKIVGKTGLTTVAQNANQQIVLGSSSTTVGITGSLTATNAGNCLELICTTAGTSTVWHVASSMGNWTVA